MPVLSTTAAVILKKVAADVAIKAVTRPRETMEKALKIIAYTLTPVVLIGAAVFAIVVSAPQSFFSTSPDATTEINRQIGIYQKMEARIRSYAMGEAQRRVEAYKKEILEKEEEANKPTPAPTVTFVFPAGYPTPSPSPTPSATPKPETKIDTDITDTLPNWRFLMALASVYNGNDFTRGGTEEYIERYVKSKLIFTGNIDTEVISGIKEYSVSVDISYYSLSQMARDLKALDSQLDADAKDGLATSRMVFLQYIADDGSQLDTPVNQVGDNNITMTPEQIAALKEKLPAGLDASREAIVIAAYSIVGKVDYFWGGKSLAIGWDSRWGTPRKVTSGGNLTTGTFRPFGLDCSGFVAWCYVNGTKDPSIVEVIGSGSTNQWNRSVPISWAEALPGDMVFNNPPAKSNHIGIVVGDDGKGNYLVAHSPRTGEKVSISKIPKTGGTRGFKYVRRSVIFVENKN